IIGVNAVKVDRLATSDLLISDKMTSAGASSLSPNTYSFTINGVTGNVTLTATDDTNEEVMQKLVTAINSTDNIGVTASYIKVDSTYSKLTLTSTDTGGANDIDFADSSIFTAFGWTNAGLNPHTTARTTATETTAGFQSANYNDLDSKLQINGVNIYRASNSVDDALPGLTLKLVKPQAAADQSVTLTSSVNASAVESLIQPILDTYNDILKYLKQDNTILRGDTAISSLYSKFRLIVSDEITSVNSGDPKYLTDIGIKIGSDGSLSINDHDRLLEVLQDDPQKVANLFTSSDSFVAKLNNTIANLTGDEGLIKSRTNSLSTQIDSTSKKTEDVQKNIDKQADILRQEYTNILSLFYQAQSNYNLLNTF
ncbi:MAG: flagellar filament capping protein FliD, partial [Ignavibacteriae bacterium]|nr:flagellar filament capping protein FliD [Ignavibacteriota bacterium]